MNKIKPYIKAVLGLAGVCFILFFVLKILFRDHEQSPEQGGLRNLATEINKHVPRALDSLVRLDYVQVINDSLVQYYHTVGTVAAGEMNADSFAVQLKKSIIQNTGSPDIGYYRKYGVWLECRYVDKNKELLCVVKAGPGDFAGNKQAGEIHH